MASVAEVIADFVKTLVRDHGLPSEQKEPVALLTVKLVNAAVEIGKKQAGLFIGSVKEQVKVTGKCPVEEQHSPERGPCPYCDYKPVPN